MAKKKVNKGLTKSSDIKLKKKSKKPAPKKGVSVENLHPKVKNKDSLTDNIKQPSSKGIKDNGLGKIKRVPLSQKLNVPKKKK